MLPYPLVTLNIYYIRGLKYILVTIPLVTIDLTLLVTYDTFLNILNLISYHPYDL